MRHIGFMRMFLCAFSFTLIGLGVALAEPSSRPSGQIAGVFGEGTDSNIDTRTGAFVWSYPFELPKARGRLQPQLGLTYSSQHGDGYAGKGWDLSIPSIERAVLYGNPCFWEDGTTPVDCRDKYTAGPHLSMEHYTFGGRALILICQVGLPKDKGGDCGEEHLPSWAEKDWRYFRLQVEGEFLRFFLAPKRTWWRVQIKGGMIAEYGAPPDFPWPAVETTRDDPEGIIRWRLVQQRDTPSESGRTENIIVYHWKDLGDRRLLFLTDVFDTPSTPFTGRPEDFAHHVQFDWAAPDIVQTSYAQAWRATPDLVLRRVAITSADWERSGPRQIVRTYDLQYQARQRDKSMVAGKQVFFPWNHAFLASIQMWGTCRAYENEGGVVPPELTCLDPLPAVAPTTFEYESGDPAFQLTNETYLDVDPDGLAGSNKMLPWLRSVGIVDFNGDGLPDVVQGWNSERCPGAHAVTNSIAMGTFDDWIYCSYTTAPTYRGVANARPITGYINRGVGLESHFDYTCMDAGAWDDPLSLIAPSGGRRPGFFSDAGSVTAVGLWSTGSLAWSYANYAPFRAVPQPVDPGLPPGGSGCNAENFDINAFNPAWRWQKSQTDVDWAKTSNDPPFNPNPGGSGPYAYSPLWVTDVDGDGLLDRLGDGGDRAADFNTARVEFTRRYWRDQHSGDIDGPIQVPFESDFAPIRSIAPSVDARASTRFFFQDINGDGFVDLITVNPRDDQGAPRVRPGDGTGYFGCIGNAQPQWACKEPPNEPVPVYNLTFTGAINPWVIVPSMLDVGFPQDTVFHDLTGDGLADVVQYDKPTGDVRLWVNQDGHNFACVTVNCSVGKVYTFDTKTTNIGEHRMTFADMDANGVDDLVILAHNAIYVGTSMVRRRSLSPGEAGAPRPGLLTRIHNGIGATTDIQYETSAELDRRTRETQWAWKYHSAVSIPVVTSVTTRDSFSAGVAGATKTYPFKRRTQIAYFDPAYDRWERRFVGFRRVAVRSGQDKAASVSTYWYGPCQNNDFNQTLPSAPDLPLCPGTSMDDAALAFSGTLARVDSTTELFPYFAGLDDEPVTAEFTPGLLSSRLFSPTPTILFERKMGRVHFAYSGRVDTYIYDAAKPTQDEGFADSMPGGDTKQLPQRQPGIRRHLLEFANYDRLGNLKTVEQRGAIRDEDSAAGVKADAVTITAYSSGGLGPDGPTGPLDGPPTLTCNSRWICSPRYISIWQPDNNGPATLLKKTRYTYTTSGNVKSVESWLDRNSPLLDRHNSGNAVAPLPDNAVTTRGWHVIGRFEYDDWNNVIRSESGPDAKGVPLRCTTIQYEALFHQMPERYINYKHGCSGEALATRMEFDRGFGALTNMTAENGTRTAVEYDGFGRPIRYLGELADDAAAGLRELTHFQYFDGNPLSAVRVDETMTPASKVSRFIVVNALGETIGNFHQAAKTGTWVTQGWVERNDAGRVSKTRGAWSFTNDPMKVADASVTLAPPTSASSVKWTYDDYGRTVAMSEFGPGIASREIMRGIFRPLSLELRDAEQLNSGSHRGAYTKLEYDGFGRMVRTTSHMVNPSALDIISTIEHDPLGRPVTWKRKAGATEYSRSLDYDTMGRPMINREPNSGGNYRYAWDGASRLVGTSDARGCGENIVYDGYGRLVGEDYSPCTSSQPPYSPPAVTGGPDGYETFYTFDSYDDGAVPPDFPYTDDDRFAVGQLVGVSDRGAITRFHYDSQSLVRQITRTIGSGGGLGPDPKSKWYTSRFDYDLAGRLQRRSSGVDLPEFLVGHESSEFWNYDDAGDVESVTSSYGSLVDSIKYDHFGAPTKIVYGDKNGTTEDYKFDGLHRLTNWSLTTPANLPFVTPNYHFGLQFEYDYVGNPVTINDQPPAGGFEPNVARIKTKSMRYDDLYRLIEQDATYDTPTGTDPWLPPFAAETAAGSDRPMPDLARPDRPLWQTYTFDGLGNIIASDDDAHTRFDRSVGNASFAGAAAPNRMTKADGIELRYDATGNVIAMKVVRDGTCPAGDVASLCGHWFVYDWDEVGQLVRARRWDFASDELPIDPPDTTAVWDLEYAYSMNVRVRKTTRHNGGAPLDTLYVFSTMRIDDAELSKTGEHLYDGDNVSLSLAGLADVHANHSLTSTELASAPGIAMNLILRDVMGNSAIVVSYRTSVATERTTYQPYGAVESDYRDDSGDNRRAFYRFSGKEDDIEVGLTYFGQRYYLAELGRFISPDPLTIHGNASDWNPYAYVRGGVTRRRDPLGLDEASDAAELKRLRQEGCLGAEKCTTDEDDSPIAKSRPSQPDQIPGGSYPPETPVPTPEVQPYDPTQGMNRLDKWINSGNGGWHDALTNDANWRTAQYVAIGVTAVALVGLDLFATGGTGTAAAGEVLFTRGITTLATGAGTVIAKQVADHPDSVEQFVTAEGEQIAAFASNSMTIVASGGNGANAAQTLEAVLEEGMAVMPRMWWLQQWLTSNPTAVRFAPNMNAGYFQLGMRNARLASAVWGKGLELYAGQLMPNLVKTMGGAYQPDAIIRVGNINVLVDWTTAGQLTQHMERAYYIGVPWLFFLHQGIR